MRGRFPFFGGIHIMLGVAGPVWFAGSSWAQQPGLEPSSAARTL